MHSLFAHSEVVVLLLMDHTCLQGFAHLNNKTRSLLALYLQAGEGELAGVQLDTKLIFSPHILTRLIRAQPAAVLYFRGKSDCFCPMRAASHLMANLFELPALECVVWLIYKYQHIFNSNLGALLLKKYSEATCFCLEQAQRLWDHNSAAVRALLDRLRDMFVRLEHHVRKQRLMSKLCLLQDNIHEQCSLAHGRYGPFLTRQDQLAAAAGDSLVLELEEEHCEKQRASVSTRRRSASARPALGRQQPPAQTLRALPPAPTPRPPCQPRPRHPCPPPARPWCPCSCPLPRTLCCAPTRRPCRRAP